MVEAEISSGNPEAAALRLQVIARIPNLEVSVEAQVLASLLLAKKVVPSNSDRDALHIAIAATQSINYLLTWNFKHNNNATLKMAIAKSIEAYGYSNPILCSPEELGEPPMTDDPIVEEMRKYGLEFTARHNHDMAAICTVLRERQQASQRPVVNRIRRPVEQTSAR